MTKAEQKYNEYIKRFCDKHEIPIEVAEQNAIIKEYKEWVIREYRDDNRREEELSKTIQACGC